MSDNSEYLKRTTVVASNTAVSADRENLRTTSDTTTAAPLSEAELARLEQQSMTRR